MRLVIGFADERGCFASTSQISKKLSAAEKEKTELQTHVNVLRPECSDLGKKLQASKQREIEMKEEIRRLLEEVH